MFVGISDMVALQSSGAGSDMNQIFYEVYLVPWTLHFLSYVVIFLCAQLLNKTSFFSAPDEKLYAMEE